MLKLENEYTSILSSPKEQNIFYKYLAQLAGPKNNREDVEVLKKFYDELTFDNSNKLIQLYEDKLQEKLNDCIKL